MHNQIKAAIGKNREVAHIALDGAEGQPSRWQLADRVLCVENRRWSFCPAAARIGALLTAATRQTEQIDPRKAGNHRAARCWRQGNLPLPNLARNHLRRTDRPLPRASPPFHASIIFRMSIGHGLPVIFVLKVVACACS